ncbi:MAG: beta-propeller domain-containing protein [Deltaproteobacteria bacterium]|nr:beta-propeller domain-containing protein [Deltaproteobacteria bacterium]
MHRDLLTLLLLLSLVRCIGTETDNPTVPKAAEGRPPKTTISQTPRETVESDLEDLFPRVGASDFETALDVEGRYGDGSFEEQSIDPDNFRGDVESSKQSAAEIADESAATSETESGPTAEREIVEADIVQMHGDILYVLNSFRGLVLIDMSQPDSPRIIGRLPFQAQPVEMYLEDERAYIVMSDYFDYWQYDDDADPLGFHGSRVLIADVSEPSTPSEMGSMTVQGEITDSRIVGDVLYVVSKRNAEYWRYDTNDWEDTTWVSSLNIADPNSIYKVDEVEFSGSANVVQVYQTALSVAAIDPNYYLVDDDNASQTKITFVDISDPQGDIKVGASAYVPGSVDDKFKMDLYTGHLRVISQDSYWYSNSLPTLTIFDTSPADILAQVSQIEIEWVRTSDTVTDPWIAATRYAQSKLLSNLCWNERVGYRSYTRCRVDFYDLSDPAAPEKAGDLRMNVELTHFEPRGDRMLSLGRQTEGSYQVVVGLYDISDLSEASLLSSITLGADSGSSSSALDDYKAFKVLDDLEMILLPLDWSTGSGNSYRYFQGAQIIDWRDDKLAERGRLQHGAYVTRAIAFKQRLVAISERHIQVVDASDRDQPITTADIYLVRDVLDVYNIKGYQIQFANDEQAGDTRFYVLPFGADDMAQSVAELPVSGYDHHRLRDGDMIHLISINDDGKQMVRTADFSDPLRPRLRGALMLSDEIEHVYGGGWSFYDYYWSPNAGRALNNRILPVTARELHASESGRRYYNNTLRLIDISDPDNPRLAEGSIVMNDYPFINRVGHGSVLYSTHTEPAYDADGNKKTYHVKYFLDRVEVTNPDAPVLLGKLNIPGELVDVDENGSLLYTIDYQFDGFGRRRNALNVLRVQGDQAVLVEVLPVGDEIDRARYMDRTVWLTAHKQPWRGMGDDTIDSRQPYTHLSKIVFDEDGRLKSALGSDLHGYHFNLLDVEDKLVYLSSNYPYGLLVLDATDVSDCKVLSSSRSIGYISKLVRHEDFLYMPMGEYGVRRAAL